MATPDPWLPASPSGVEGLVPLGARRLLTLAGIGMILVGMVLGDLFAVFSLHQNAAKVGTSLGAAVVEAAARNAAGVRSNFKSSGESLENRGTKVDAHAHLSAFGYLALLLALLQPWIELSESSKTRLAWLLVSGGALLPVSVFLIYYVGLAYSPFQFLGWASLSADLGGFMVLAATAVYLWGLGRHFRRSRGPVLDRLLPERSVAARRLLAGGLALILGGFLHGAYYAGIDLYHQEAQDYAIISKMSSGVTLRDRAQIDGALAEFGRLQGDKAVKVAAHAHVIEFGLLAILLAFFQPYVQLREAWKLRWARVLLFGSLLLPVSVLLELRYGLLAGGIADLGGLLVIIALLATWIGILRYTGSLDAGMRGAEC